jgi:hypothetical protein
MTDNDVFEVGTSSDTVCQIRFSDLMQVSPNMMQHGFVSGF